jgi:hypothetical protein
VDDAAVVTGLVSRQLLLALEHHGAEPGAPLQQLASGGQPEDPAADDGQVELAGMDALVQRASREAMS